MARSARIIIAVCLVLALPGLIFGFLLRVTEPERCRPGGGSGLLGVLERPECRTLDPTMVVACVLVLAVAVIALGIRSASRGT